MASKVLFTREISPEKVIELYKALGRELCGKVAIKLHSGEVGNQNFLRPEFWKPMIDSIGGTVVETNTAYGGKRDTSEDHWKTIELHGWNRYFEMDIMDEEGPDTALPIPNGKLLKQNLVGKHMANYDSMLVLAHFKGHPMAGFGGAIKQLGIGCASAAGKAYIHGAGVLDDAFNAAPEGWLTAMAEAASTVAEQFGDKIVYINVMKNLSVDCDCCAVAEDPCMNDIGILASLDPLALDQACIDLIYSSKDKGRDHFVERVESRKGLIALEAADALGMGSRQYDLVSI